MNFLVLIRKHTYLSLYPSDCHTLSENYEFQKSLFPALLSANEIPDRTTPEKLYLISLTPTLRAPRLYSYGGSVNPLALITLPLEEWVAALAS